MKSLLTISSRTLKIALIGLPLVAAATYFMFFAADRYVSEATVAINQTGTDTSAIPGAALVLAAVSSPSKQDAQFIARYIHSRALMKRLDAELKLREHYASPSHDLPFRLSASSSEEDVFAYYRQRVQVIVDDTSSMLTVRVQAFDRQFAQQLVRRLLEESEKFVNDSSQSIAREQLKFADSEARAAGQRLQDAKEQLLAFQTRNRLLDPSVQARTTEVITSELQGLLARRQTELRGLLTYLNDSAPQVKALRTEVQALQTQIDAERGRATTAQGTAPRLNALAADYQGLRLRVDFALDAYKLALTAVENTRIEATRKLKTLVIIDPPSLPESAEYPLRLYNLATVFVASVLLYLVVRLLLVTIREHQD